jgi:hypothetical protein
MQLGERLREDHANTADGAQVQGTAGTLMLAVYFFQDYLLALEKSEILNIDRGINYLSTSSGRERSRTAGGAQA